VVEPVELRSPLVSDSGIGADCAKKSRGQRGVDALEELQEDETDRVSLRQELIAAGVWKLGDEPPWLVAWRDRSEARQAYSGPGNIRAP
jgi:hypothetical protein